MGCSQQESLILLPPPHQTSELEIKQKLQPSSDMLILQDITNDTMLETEETLITESAEAQEVYQSNYF